jgi:hypothetical protein
MIQTTLGGTDVSTEDGEGALGPAADLARAYGAEMVVVGLTQAPDPRQLFEYAPRRVPAARQVRAASHS